MRSGWSCITIAIREAVPATGPRDTNEKAWLIRTMAKTWPCVQGRPNARNTMPKRNADNTR